MKGRTPTKQSGIRLDGGSTAQRGYADDIPVDGLVMDSA